MDRYGLFEHIRRRILNDENKANNWKSHGVEKAANKPRKFRITHHEIPSTKNKFEKNVLRKAQNIRSSAAFKQCCRRLSGHDDENFEIITKPYSSMPSLYTSKSVSRDEKISQHINSNIDECGPSSSCDEINVKIKQSFSTLNNLENDIDEAARFLQASFSNRLSISSQFECDKMIDDPSSKEYILEKHPYNDHIFPKQDAKGVTHGETLGSRLEASITYGKHVTEMNQHLRDVRGAFNSQLLLCGREVDDGRNSPSNERCFGQQSSFYSTVQQRMNKALQHNSLSNNVSFCVKVERISQLYRMYKSSQYLLKERNDDAVDLPVSSFSKTDSSQDTNGNDDEDDGKNEVRSAETEVTPKTTVQQAENSDMELISESSPTDSILNDVNRNDEVNSSPTYSSQELLKREHYVSNTVKALRQFYSDSVLYFVELRKLYSQRKVEDLWKLASEEERIKAACLLLKRKYIDSVHGAMPLKNLVDYHLHETARIQLLNLDLQKHLTLLRGRKKDSNFEKFRRYSEKVLLFTKNFEKNNLANELERWELKLRTRSRGFKIDGDRAANIDNTQALFSNPLRVVRNIHEVKVRNPASYNKNLQQLREELKWKRKEADFLKRTFDERVMRNDQRHVLIEENSLRAQINAHVRYITETEKDIAQLIKLQNGNDNNEKSTVLPGYPISPSRLTSMKVSAERTFSDGEFSEADKSRTTSSADGYTINKSCSSERDHKKGNIESSQFSKLLLEEESGTDSVSEKYKNLHSPGRTRGTCSFIGLSSSNTLTPSERLSERSLKSNYVEGSCSASNETPLSKDNKLPCSQNVPTVLKDPASLTIHSPGSNHSSELIFGETVNFKQDTSKEALLISVVGRSDVSYSQVEEQEQLAVQSNDIIDGNEIATDRCNLPSNIVDEQFFTPLPSDIETDNEEKGDDEIEKEGITSQESSSSFHTTVPSPTPDVQMDNKLAQTSLLSPPPKSRQFKLTVSPLSSSRSPTPTRYAASMPREDSSRSTTNSSRTSKTASNRCISPLSASILESLLEDSLTTMLKLEHSQAFGSQTLVLHEEDNKCAANSAAISTDNSWQSDQSYDLNRIPMPEDLIPGLDLSGVNNAEVEAVTDENDFPSNLEDSSAKIRDVRQIKSPEPAPSSQFRYYLGDEEWVIAEIHSVSEKIWNLISSKQPLEVLVNDNQSGIASQEVQIRQMIADRCCEIAQRCFKDVGRSRYMGLTNINCSRPRNLLHLKSMLQKQLSKYYESSKRDAKEKKRWELLSRGCNSDIENIVLEELYAEQDSWEDALENYEDEIKAELASELWHEQLDESLSVTINI
uniref:Bm8421 n=1 Tax=Loa loa TaxID=7209 RepID=A0A1I7V704_LOALO